MKQSVIGVTCGFAKDPVSQTIAFFVQSCMAIEATWGLTAILRPLQKNSQHSSAQQHASSENLLEGQATDMEVSQNRGTPI